MNRSPSSQHLLARCFGAIGSAVISGDIGSLCCALKPFCSPLAQFSTWRERMFPYRMCLPVPNEPIGGSVGSNVSLAMLASLPPHHLRSPFMVSRSALLTSFFSDLFCSVCPQYPQISLDLVFPRHFAVFLLHEHVVAPLIVCLLSSRCVSRGEQGAKGNGHQGDRGKVRQPRRKQRGYQPPDERADD